MRLLSLLVAMYLTGCAVDLPQARDCLKNGYVHEGLIGWKCNDGETYWIPDRKHHE